MESATSNSSANNKEVMQNVIKIHKKCQKNLKIVSKLMSAWQEFWIRASWHTLKSKHERRIQDICGWGCTLGSWEDPLKRLPSTFTFLVRCTNTEMTTYCGLSASGVSQITGWSLEFISTSWSNTTDSCTYVKYFPRITFPCEPLLQ